ncbi:MAG TPA: hypothetical protein PK771_09460 [Spirochaetota bacterium]|nr:hypothetical protein [Spirochaetota bacterium]
MLLVKKNVLHFNFAIFIIFILVLGISSYLVINRVNLSEPLNVKFYSETIIFIMIIFILISLIIYSIIYFKSIKISKELDKIIEITKYGNYDIEKSLIKLSELGAKIKELHHNLSILNEQKSIKISSLSNLLIFFLNNTELNILITDIEGLITNTSASFFKNFDISISEILYNNINVFKAINFLDIVITLDNTREKIIKEKIDIEINKKEQKINIVFIPVTNIRNQLSNVICIFEKNNFLGSSKFDLIK